MNPMKDKEKPSFASLNPSLLARKGGARPAMRPQLQPLPGGGQDGQPLEDLGWNDMGHEPEDRHVDPLPLTPASAPASNEEVEPDPKPPVVRRQQEAIAESLEQAPVAESVSTDTIKPSVEPKTMAKPRPVKRSTRRRANGHALNKGKRAAFTLRLDQGRHLKLRLACTMNNRSAQQIVTEALDSFLEEIPDLDSLAAKVKRH